MSLKAAVVCGDSEEKNCVACEGNNRPPVKMRECPLCDGSGNIGLFAGFFQALDLKAGIPEEKKP